MALIQLIIVVVAERSEMIARGVRQRAQIIFGGRICSQETPVSSASCAVCPTDHIFGELLATPCSNYPKFLSSSIVP